jgi:hypothetical protein
MVIIRIHTKTYWGWRELYVYKYIIKKIYDKKKYKYCGGFFKINCDAMDGDLRRLKKILEAPWLIYVILKGIGKVSNRFYKFSFLVLIGWGRYEWKKRWRQNVPLENCRRSHLTFNPNILMLIPFIYRYLTIIYREELAINHPWMPTRWCCVQKFTCWSTGSRYQYIVIWWGWHYRIFSVLLGRLLHSWMINGEFLSVNYC